jgi:hypothetical protein
MTAENQQTDRLSRREELLEAIAHEEARLARLEAEHADSRCRLDALRTELASLGSESEIRVCLPRAAEATAPRTSAEKLKLFRSLFHGREDVFATRFVSKKTRKPGYAPACANKFVKGVCDLPKVKCGECLNQAFIRLDDEAVIAHFTGRQVIGVYPILEDETCWFLAADFDKSNWTEDVRAFVETCRHIGLPVVVERSRSGNGAHMWFFFSSPVPASTAQDGLLPHHRDYGAAASAEHGIVRSPIPQPGHDAARWLWEPDCIATPTRTKTAREHGLPR